MTHTLDITKEHCPMTMVKVKLKLSQMASGDQLEVVLSGKEPLENVPRSAEEQGFQVVSVEPFNGNHRVIIRK